MSIIIACISLFAVLSILVVYACCCVSSNYSRQEEQAALSLMKKSLMNKKDSVPVRKGLFVTFEGGEGSGKTTLVQCLKEKLEKNGYKVIITREPGGCHISEHIRDFIMKHEELDNMTEIALYAAARRQHCIDTIYPALNDNAIILCDRYIHSNMVYQNNEFCGMDDILDINKMLGVILPDITFFLDIPPKIGLKRIQSGNRNINRYDSKGIEYHQKVYEGYKQLLETEQMLGIDASKNCVEDIINDIYEKIIKLKKGCC